MASAAEQWIEQSLEQGLEPGRREGLLAGIELAVELRIGEAALRLLPQIALLQDLQLLQAIHAAVRTAASPDEVRRIYQG